MNATWRRLRCRLFGHRYQISVGVVDSMWCDRCGEVFKTREGSGIIVIEDWPTRGGETTP